MDYRTGRLPHVDMVLDYDDGSGGIVHELMVPPHPSERRASSSLPADFVAVSDYVIHFYLFPLVFCDY